MGTLTAQERLAFQDSVRRLLAHIVSRDPRLTLAADAWDAIAASCATVDAIVAKGDPAYGINTGFGILAKAHIPNDQLEALQRNLILSHAVGTGAPWPAG